ncbi:hypothetical protein TWF694_006900 [Orbilia ellipsospora]|uniref:DUF6923 domain-containing protein n=1 Tax=Orbilia ellipsospora TaxID=2528407 RepID=A0AAV9XN30_9PEZI
MTYISRFLVGVAVVLTALENNVAVANPFAIPNEYCPTVTKTKTYTEYKTKYSKTLIKTTTCTKTTTRYSKTSTCYKTKTSTKNSTKTITKTSTKTSTKTVTSNVSAGTVTKTVTDTQTKPVTDIVTVTATETQPVTDIVTVTASTSSCPAVASPTFACSEYGFIVDDLALYKIDLHTAEFILVTDDVDGSNTINALGYNVIDNYLYANEVSTGTILRIAADGSIERVVQIPAIQGAVIGDIDTNGKYILMISKTGDQATWGEVDLNPTSPTYGQLTDTGTSTASGFSFVDWAFVPATPSYLWTLAVDGSGGYAVLVNYNINSHVYTRVKEFPGLPATAFGAIFAVNNGDLYCNQNASGDVYLVNIFTQDRPRVVAHGETVSNTDGARCAWNIIEAAPASP